ncbi:MAG: prepilin-type N-terminal cleavage/methylation domain-containing protein [Campylobacteraceae bacterium]|jgi:prepilin-type N-terminal cleavage/methylation domain-containing protein|nr:prepilin-type N-terminal cleavage/methylation domain-containing protein [Campylobacteraceae bacterium]
MKKNAFTMMEIVIVIVIFGIIASIGANIIAKMYMNYIQSRAINYLQTQSGITLEQIAKRLQYRIKQSTIARKMDEAPPNNIYYLENSNVDDTFDVIEWIGYSNEAMLTGKTPGWSGFIDLDNIGTVNPDLTTPGSDLDKAINIMKVLSYDKVDLTTTSAALIFKNKKDTNPAAGFGWDGNGGNAAYMLKVEKNTANTFKITGDKPSEIYEHYYLAHSAYAIVPVNTRSDVDFDLELRYNYQPWSSTVNTYDNADTSKALLATHVNLFRVKQTGNTIRLKLCLHDNNASGFNNYIVACKEEVVL